MRIPERTKTLSTSLLVALAFSVVGCATNRTVHVSGHAAAEEAIKPPPVEKPKGKNAKPAPSLGAKSWVSFDGETFPSTRWGPKPAQTQTVIVAVHGLSGAASDFRALGEFFTKRFTAVYSYALRGQGNDPKKERVGDIKSPMLWYKDLDTYLTLVRSDNPKARMFLYGESLGCLISVHGLETLSAENRAAIRGLILSSPVVSLKDRDKVSKFKYAALKGAIKFLPKRKITLEKLAGDKKDMRITGDTDHRENIRNTPHAVDQFSFRLLGALEKMIYGSREKASKIEKPILILYPANDLLTTAKDVEAWYAALQTKDKEKHLFAKSFHLLLHDKERAAVLDRVRRWLGRH